MKKTTCSENIRCCVAASHYSPMLALGRKCALHPPANPAFSPALLDSCLRTSEAAKLTRSSA